MIGIVVVSHSRALAEAAVGLAREMVTGDGPVIAVAAGLDATTFGTDATAVAEAITTADSPDGVLVLLDLGSALLSAELALEFLDPDVQERVLLTSAPLVEGLVAAVVLASTGAPIDAVASEARNGLVAKQEHLGDTPSPGAATSTPDDAGEPEQGVEVTVANEHGLHARPAARLVGLVRSFDAQVTLTDLTTGRGPVDAGSLSLVATLDVRQGHQLRIGASGPAAAEALDAVRALAAQGFGDLPNATATGTRKADGRQDGRDGGRADGQDVRQDGRPAGSAVAADGRDGERGNFSSPGDEKVPQLVARPGGSGLDIAIGWAVVPAGEVDVSGYQAGDVRTERQRSDVAVAHVTTELERIRDETKASVGPDEAEVFDAHLALLDDPALTDGVDRALDDGQAATDAWARVLDGLAERFEALDDSYQRARAQDVRAVRRQLLTALVSAPIEPNRTSQPEGAGAEHDGGEVLVVEELDPATAATVDAVRTAGIATRAGGATGHGVIVARSRGIPIITDIGSVQVGAGQLVAFDAKARRFLVEPDAEVLRELTEVRDARATLRRTAIAEAAHPAETADGHRIAVLANVGSVADAEAAAGFGAEGSGLIRTEVLFGNRATAPSVDEQTETYLAIARALGGRPITIRTWDVGGDKPLPFLPMPAEPNPFLGRRGLRAFRDDPSLLVEQLQAVCRTAERTAVKVMFPMVTTAEEVAWARSLLADAPDGLRVGVMVEVPALAVRVQQLTAGLDFVSIGTNDLTQYTTASDRGNAAVAKLADALDPAVLELVARVAQRGPDAAVCGDLAGDPGAAVLLVGLGVRELSAVGPQVPMVKARLRSVRLADAIQLADQALTLRSATEVRSLLNSEL